MFAFSNELKIVQKNAMTRGKEDIKLIKESSHDKEDIITNLKNLSEELKNEKQKIQNEYNEELKKLEEKYSKRFNYISYRNREIVLEIDNMKYIEGE